MMFCPSCGKEKEKSVGKICLDCFVRDKELVKVPDYLDVEYCVKCDSFKEEGNWREPKEKEHSKVEAAESAVMSSLGVHKKVKNPRIALEPDVGGDQINFDIEIYGEIKDEPIALNASTKVRLDKTSCKRCGKISGGYFESIIQVRGQDRDLSSDEIDKISEEAFSISEEAQERERMSFIGEIKENDGGLDIYVGSSELAQRISRSVIQEFGGNFSKSSSLIGMDDGQEVHRVTYSVRLPPFSVGDIIDVDGELIGVNEVGDVVKGIKLEDGDSFRRNWKYLKDNDIEKIGKKEDLKQGIISLVRNKEVQVVEPWEYKNVVVKKPEFLEKQDEGSEVSLLKHGRKFYLLPKSFEEK